MHRDFDFDLLVDLSPRALGVNTISNLLVVVIPELLSDEAEHLCVFNVFWMLRLHLGIMREVIPWKSCRPGRCIIFVDIIFIVSRIAK